MATETPWQFEEIIIIMHGEGCSKEEQTEASLHSVLNDLSELGTFLYFLEPRSLYFRQRWKNVMLLATFLAPWLFLQYLLSSHQPTSCPAGLAF